MSVIDLETYSNDSLQPQRRPSDARTQAINLGPNLTVPKGRLLGKKTSDGKFYLYNDANSDGTEVAKCINKTACKTDADGNVYYSDSAVASSINIPFQTTQVYVAGTFKISELVGYDAAALADFNGKLDEAGDVMIPN